MIDVSKKALDSKNSAGTILTELLKAFCLNHDLLIAKLAAYGFGNNALKSYLRLLERKKTKNQSIQFLQLLES